MGCLTVPVVEVVLSDAPLLANQCQGGVSVCVSLKVLRNLQPEHLREFSHLSKLDIGK